MSAEALLATLMAQAEGRGADLVTLRALVEESSQAGARRALASLGLDDERARRDMDELRELIDLLRENGLAELELENEGFRVRLRREPTPPEPVSYIAPPLALPAPTAAVSAPHPPPTPSHPGTHA